MTGSDTKPEKPRKDGLVVLMAFLGFFLVFSAVDAFFVYKAVITHTGTVTDNAYEKGLAYNRTLAEARAQAALDAKAKVFYQDGALSLETAGKDAPPQNATIKARLERAVEDKDDIEINFTPVSDDKFSAPVDLPHQGLWNIYIEAKWQDSKQQEKTYKTMLAFIAR